MGKLSERHIFLAKVFWTNPLLRISKALTGCHGHSTLWPTVCSSPGFSSILHPCTYCYLYVLGLIITLHKSVLVSNIPLLLRAKADVYKSQGWTGLTYLNHGKTWGPLPHTSNKAISPPLLFLKRVLWHLKAHLTGFHLKEWAKKNQLICVSLRSLSRELLCSSVHSFIQSFIYS